MIKKRIEQLLDALNKGIYEKENELALSLFSRQWFGASI